MCVTKTSVFLDYLRTCQQSVERALGFLENLMVPGRASALESPFRSQERIRRGRLTRGCRGTPSTGSPFALCAAPSLQCVRIMHARNTLKHKYSENFNYRAANSREERGQRRKLGALATVMDCRA